MARLKSDGITGQLVQPPKKLAEDAILDERDIVYCWPDIVEVNVAVSLNGSFPLRCALCCVRCAVCAVLCALCCVRCALCVLCAVRCALCGLCAVVDVDICLQE